ncbi:acyltransferase [Polynucleobacter paneuropaeus]|nr:acyltransferase [Polynucleobacter paneuropaeus]
MNGSPKQLNYDIATLRAIAILLVLGYHFFPGVMPWGFVGVDIFFVISGFLMSKILIENEDIGLLQFYKNRFRRIYPGLLIALVLCLILGYQVLLDDEYSILLSSISFSLLNLQNIYEIFHSGYFINTVNFRPLLNLWSLGVEFQFYIIFPILLLLGKRVNLRFGNSILCIFIISIALCFLLPEILNERVFFFPLTRFWEFSAGAFCYLFLKYIKSFKLGMSLFLIFGIVVCALCTALFVRPESIYPSYITSLPVGFSCFFILAKPSYLLNKNILRLLLFIASISFSLYLWHYPLIEFIRQSYGPPTISQRFVLLAISFVGAYIVDLYFSPRILSLKNSTLLILSLTFLLLVLSVAVNLNLNNIYRNINIKNINLINKNNFQVDYKESCEFLTGVKNNEDRCRVSAKSGVNFNFLILGDSHANAFTTVFDSLAEQDVQFSSYIQLGRGLCPLIPGIGDSECQKLTNIAIKFATDPNNPRYIILAGQWPLYINNRTPPAQKDVFIAGLNGLIETLSKAGKKLIFIDTVPLGAIPRSCIARIANAIPGNCNIPIQTVIKRESEYRDLISEKLLKSGVAEFDSRKYLCSESQCLVYDNNNILYLDDSHLSRMGGSYIASRSLDWWLENVGFSK